MKVIEHVDNKKDMSKEDRQAIARWDERFSKIKEELAKKHNVFSDLNDVVNWHYKPRRYAIKIVRKASCMIDNIENEPLYEIAGLFIKEAASRIFKHYKRRNCMIAQDAEQHMHAYSGKARELPDLLNENFFKHALRAVRTWQI